MTAMVPRSGASLRTRAPWRVLDGFGRSVQAACRYAAPRSIEELAEVFARAAAEGLTIGFRGSGRSYGDAALNSSGLVIDATAINRLRRWEPETGIVEAEPGLTIEGLWRRTIEDGYWPAVVPGTMRPTLGGCVSMNIHGKNNFRMGPFGDHVLEFDLLTPAGELLHCSRERNAEVFHAALGGMGLLGAVTRVKLKLKHVSSGRLRVTPLATRNLLETFELFESHLPHSDYLVGWMDCFARGDALGRGQLHAANYLEPGEDPDQANSLHVERQGLPGHIMGVPRSQIWKLMRCLFNDPGIALANTLKYQMARWADRKSYLQSHVAFAFLLDYVPDWRLAYGPTGFIQYQIFVPHAEARQCFRDVLEHCQREGICSYLAVLKRHRPDAYLLSHALDGWSLALDFRVTADNRDKLWNMTHRLTERVLAAKGKFYFAKDSVLRPADFEQAYGRERIERFVALKQRLDPTRALQNDLWARITGTERRLP